MKINIKLIIIITIIIIIIIINQSLFSTIYNNIIFNEFNSEKNSVGTIALYCQEKTKFIKDREGEYNLNITNKCCGIVYIFIILIDYNFI